MATGSTNLQTLNSFGVESRTNQLITINHLDQLSDLNFDPERDLVLGGGSNVLLVSHIPGQVLLNRITGRTIKEGAGGKRIVSVGSGEPWHAVVRWTLKQGLSGLENLSLIPGLTGAAPIQNIGAYGVELSSVLHRVHAWDWRKRELKTFRNQDCEFAYRDSRFKSREPHRWFIVGLELALHNETDPVIDYAGLMDTLEVMGALPRPTALQISDAVIRLRQNKLPDPETIGNAGSFFKNPELSADHARTLKQQFEELPLFPGGKGTRKASAAWMIQHCGWKGFRDGDAGVSEQHALVLVNHGNAMGSQIAALSERIRLSVLDRFGIDLETEPRIVQFKPSRINEPAALMGSRSQS